MEGLRGLTRGLGPTLARDVPFSSLYLAFYDLLKQKVASQTQLAGISPEAAHMTAGLGAGLLASLVTQVKKKCQSVKFFQIQPVSAG